MLRKKSVPREECSARKRSARRTLQVPKHSTAPNVYDVNVCKAPKNRASPSTGKPSGDSSEQVSMTKDAVSLAIVRHVSASWPEQRRNDFEWRVGPIRETVPGLVVTRIEPRVPMESWHYVSRGLWQIEGDGPRLELMLSPPYSDPIHVETIAMVANLHADPRYRVHLGKIINIGRPWIEGASCDHLLISLPYLLGPQFEYLRVLDLTIRFLWLLPITRSEAAYARMHGVDALESAFEKAGFDTSDPSRNPVV